MPNKIISGNPELDAMIDSLINVDSGTHKNSSRYTAMENSLHDLADTIQKYSPKNGQDTILTAEALQELRQKYDAAIRKCNDYTRWKWTGRSSGYGQGRLECVRSLRSMLEEDFAALKSVKPDDKKTLGSVFTMSRTDEVEMTIADKDIRTIGANSSVRVPLEIQTETGTAKGIFTEESKVQTLKEIADGLQKQYGDAVASELLDCFKVNKKDPSEAEFDDGGYNMAKFDELDTDLKECFKQMKHMTITDADMINEKDTFMFIFHSALTKNMGSERARKYLGKISESEESRKEFLDFAHDLSSDLHDYFVANTGGMEAGSSVPDRNVGMCRVAESLGIGHLVAGAKKIRLKDSDGFVRQGVFQETVEYSDYARLKNNDPLYEIGRNPQLMDDPNILMQIADLQILDYVCGNNDRHQSNILYDMQIVDGKPKLVAIKGIDNDRSLGLLTKKDIEEFGHITPPDMMKVIRLSTATALAELSEDKLRLMLHDLSISDAEVKAAMKRVEDIKDAINKGKIKILDDEDFKKYKMDDLTESKMVGEEKKSNTFAIIGAIRNNIKKRKPVPEQDLPYNSAKAVTEKQYRRADTGPLYLQAVKAHAAELESTLAKFVEKKYLHINSSAYDWMEKSMKNIIQAAKDLEKDGSVDHNGQLNEESARKIDTLYRQLRTASSKYLEGHKNPSSPMGQARRDGALKMKDFWPVRQDSMDVAVHEINADEIAGAVPAVNHQVQHHPPVKPSLKRTIRNAQRQV